MNVSPHFTIDEVTRSQMAARHRPPIDNALPPQYLLRAKTAAINLLEPVRCEYGKPFTPSSWYRSPKLNKAVGGSAKSQHMSAYAIDFEVPGISNLEVVGFMVRNLDYDQIILEFYNGIDENSGWIHASYVSRQENRRNVLQYDGQVYLPFTNELY